MYSSTLIHSSFTVLAKSVTELLPHNFQQTPVLPLEKTDKNFQL